jgi:hypothetical protein
MRLRRRLSFGGKAKSMPAQKRNPRKTKWINDTKRPTLAELTAGAELLVRVGRRGEAIEMLEEVDVDHEPRVVLVIARLHLESGTRQGAEACIEALTVYRMWNRWDFDAIALMRAALESLGAARRTRDLDREVRWSAWHTPAEPARVTRTSRMARG